MLIPIPLVHVATISACVDSEVVPIVVHVVVVVPFVPSFVNHLVYVVIGTIDDIPIDLFQKIINAFFVVS